MDHFPPMQDYFPYTNRKDNHIIITFEHVALLFLPSRDAAGCMIVAKVDRRGVQTEHALDSALGVNGLKRHAEAAQVATLHPEGTLSFQQT